MKKILVQIWQVNIIITIHVSHPRKDLLSDLLLNARQIRMPINAPCYHEMTNFPFSQFFVVSIQVPLKHAHLLFLCALNPLFPFSL